MTDRLVMLADDDPIALRAYGQILVSAGYDVETARDGTEALAQIPLARPAVVLLDLDMPGLNGLQVARALRLNPDTRHIRIIALTARANAATRSTAAEIGFDAFLEKPCPGAALLNELERQLSLRGSALGRRS